jgi:hypothetical protein
MDEQTARSLAGDMVREMLAPIFSFPGSQKYEPLNMLQLMYIGAYFSRTMVRFGGDPLNDELYSILETLPPDPDRVADYLFKRMLAGKETFDEIIEARNKITDLSKRPASYRRAFIDLFKEAIPGGLPGRTRKLEEADLPQLAALSDQLLPAIKALLVLRKQVPRRGIQESLEFLAQDFPHQVKYLVECQPDLEQLLQDKKVLRTAKTEKSRSRLLADAMAGRKFQLKPSYAVRKAKEARRRSKIATNTTKTQN